MANQANHNHIKNDERGISTVETFKKSNKLKKGKGGKGTGEKRLEDRFYPKDEWIRLTQEQCNKVTELAKVRERKELAIVHTQSVRQQLQKAVIEMIMRIMMPRVHHEKMVETNLVDQHTRKG